MSKRKDRRCKDCSASLSGRGGRAIRCVPCQDAVDQERAEARSERRSTRRSLRRQGLVTEFVDPGEEIVDYTKGGTRPPIVEQGARHPYAANPRHDHVTRVRQDYAAAHQEDADPDMGVTPWSSLSEMQADRRSVDFSGSSTDTFNRRGFYGSDRDYEVVDHASDGDLFRRMPDLRALSSHLTSRIPGRR